MVVLIDDEKLERMATDESFRKKYEGIIAMAQNGSQKLQAVAQKNPGIRKLVSILLITGQVLLWQL